MNKKLITLPALALLLAATACSYSTQGTSGAQYLKRYEERQYASVKPDGNATDIDKKVQEIAQIEPHLVFPARIGIARIEHGHLTSLPADEGQAWLDAANKLGDSYGEFVPVSPLIAEIVATPTTTGSTAARVVSTIRQGAARQHLDYVLVYEVGVSRRDKANVLSLADLTIVGMFVVPSRSINVEATASGILLDVRNGYPYATLTAHSEKKGISRAVSTVSTQTDMAITAKGRAVMKLAEQFKAAMGELAEKNAQKTDDPK